MFARVDEIVVFERRSGAEVSEAALLFLREGEDRGVARGAAGGGDDVERVRCAGVGGGGAEGGARYVF